MSKIASFRDVIALWPSMRLLAEEIGVPIWPVLKWKQRNSIPAEHWSTLLELPRARDAGLTAERLADLASRRVEAA